MHVSTSHPVAALSRPHHAPACSGRSYGAGGEGLTPLSLDEANGCATMTQVDDLSRCLAAFDQHTTLTVVVEMSAASWLVAAMIPGVARQPVKKLEGTSKNRFPDADRV